MNPDSLTWSLERKVKVAFSIVLVFVSIAAALTKISGVQFADANTFGYLILTVSLGIILLFFLTVSAIRQMRVQDKNHNQNITQRSALLLFSTTAEREKMLQGLLELLARNHGYSVSAFYRHQSGIDVSFEVGHGVPADLPKTYRSDEGLVGKALQSMQVQVATSIDTQALRLQTGIGMQPVAVMAAPIGYRQKPLGVLILGFGEEINASTQTFVENVANQLGVALHNIQQLDDLKTLSEALHQKTEDLHKKNVQLERADQAKSEFLATMSHELRTPLNAIIGFSEALKNGLAGDLSSEQLEFVNDIFGSGEHLLSLINDILDLAKVESGKMTLELETVHLSDLLKNSISMVKEKAHHQNVKLVVEADESLPPISADVRKLKQIVYNLLSNAVKFTQENGSVTLRATRVADTLEISVIDTGIGINSQDQGKLFKPFSQIDSSLARKHQGTGLGLVMIRNLAELHGGTVGLESTVGKGSRFWAKIPWRKPKTSAGAGATVSSKTNTFSRSHKSSPGLALIVEDDSAASNLLMHQLQSVNLYSVVLDNAEQALSWLQRNTPAVIVLDVLLPGSIDGWEMLKQTKLLPHLAQVPVVVVSIVADEARGLSLGASHVLQKPVSHQQLEMALMSVGIGLKPVAESKG
jgi:signal transduction histidine kinase/CheY-like chemotaxis protein